MSKQNVQKHYALEKHREKEKTRSKNSSTNFLLSKHWKKIYPIGLHKTGSSLSLSSLSLTLSQTSNDSSITDSSSITPLDQKISLALRLIASSREKKEVNSTTCNKNVARTVSPARSPSPSPSPSEEEFMRRCNWITSTSDKVYVQFHDECWGVPVYDDQFRHPRNVPLRTPKAETISKDLLKKGFRFVGPVIVYSFMQAAGMTIDHLVDCFRHKDCVNLAERPWRHV
ncbi:putative o-linked n-acetylglucosamine transferase, ogt [Capsicum annuum]|nr:putative o-linked n-acetylglucosamine transferase, ogt [Capsicum annuum]